MHSVTGATGAAVRCDPAAGKAGVACRYRAAAANAAREGKKSTRLDIAPGDSRLTASFQSVLSAHDDQTAFTIELRFSEEVKLSYVTPEDDVFSIAEGKVTGANRLDKPSNMRWRIVVKPDFGTNVTIVLPVTTDCAADGAICTGDGRKLSNSLSFTVSGPGQ